LSCGIENREIGLQLINQACYFLPHILRYRPTFWEGRQTGYKSFRTKGFDKFPRTGLPEYFDSVASYDNFLDTLVKPIVLTTLRKYGGIYVYIPFTTQIEGICDMSLTVEETMCIVCNSTGVAKLYKLNM
jgi:carboxylate-amine ligase